ncbi:16S rRNA (adenine(1518)-N(6)/adenine(1519)-N(6))-dimethyltransferase RsmA [Pajaroellobacter abortibovis]|uniref:Ribosomal RNA small subunit methyltransferase A n=1 Tax=Pajaroellobacter abortibovis TaxID=1882918 RepID=A0A1L6MV60_9BACT|nr:16S rRNA (adenine(1518)-N(6)/adenine(1519)-N(6))-dimethyltransferase RsmA [Pajaroellobacter abortibovis]APR99404.1 ribosomal RNA small subunit methyltransferase A [Pajaroellobacter abortibovis]
MLNSRILLQEAGIFPKKKFGQNFLVVESIGRTIAEVSILEEERGKAHVIEWGAGVGALTSFLLERAQRVSAVERDRDLIPILHSVFEEPLRANQLSIHEADAQTLDIASLFAVSSPSSPHILVGNLPYFITGSLLRRATEQVEHLSRAVFMLQSEVADRLLATPGAKSYGALTVFVHNAFAIHRIQNIPPSCFFPSPNVRSTLVHLLPRRPRITEETSLFQWLVHKAFEKRRKTLRNAWAGWIEPQILVQSAETCGISLNSRGETLSVQDFARMTLALQAAQRRHPPPSDRIPEDRNL